MEITKNTHCKIKKHAIFTISTVTYTIEKTLRYSHSQVVIILFHQILAIIHKNVKYTNPSYARKLEQISTRKRALSRYLMKNVSNFFSRRKDWHYCKRIHREKTLQFESSIKVLRGIVIFTRLHGHTSPLKTILTLSTLKSHDESTIANISSARPMTKLRDSHKTDSSIRLLHSISN